MMFCLEIFLLETRLFVPASVASLQVLSLPQSLEWHIDVLATNVLNGIIQSFWLYKNIVQFEFFGCFCSKEFVFRLRILVEAIK